MIAFLFGPDAWRLKTDAQALAAAFRQNGQGITVISSLDLSDSRNLDELERLIRHPSLLRERLAVTVRSACATSQNADKLCRLLKDSRIAQDAQTFLIVAEAQEEKELSKHGKHLLDFLKKNAQPVQSYPFMTGTHLTRWITESCRRLGHTIEPAAAQLLISLVGNDSWALTNELAKLSDFTCSGTIKTGDVEKLVVAPVDPNIFDFIDALGHKDKVKALGLLYRELAGGRDPYYLLTMITYQFRNLLLVKDLAARDMAAPAIARTACLHPFVVRKVFQQAGRFTMADLRRIWHRLFALDIEAKSGAADLPLALNAFILGL